MDFQHLPTCTRLAGWEFNYGHLRKHTLQRNKVIVLLHMFIDTWSIVFMFVLYGSEK